MEPHKELSGAEKFRPNPDEGPKAYFEKALAFTREFYSQEMDSIASVRFEDVSQEHFFREHIWVVHATGFSAKAVGKFMPRLLEAYGPWNLMTLDKFDDVYERVRKVCDNRQKIKAVYATADLMCSKMFVKEHAVGWHEFKQDFLSTPAKLAELPYIGKVTCFHLGRNIGLLECVKPDLHLIRLADHWGFKDCEEMCRAVRPDGMPLGLVDLCLWYVASFFGTIDIRKKGGR